MIDPADDAGFLSRWSRRKRGLERETDAPATPAADEGVEIDGTALHEFSGANAAADPDEALELEGLSDEELLDRLGLKDPDTLARGDDFAGFMRASVPEHLRRRALRQLWRSNPILANLDGLNDYEEDFRLGSVAAGSLATAYKVGRGLVSHVVDNRSKLPRDPRSGDAVTETQADADPADPLEDARVETGSVDAPLVQGGMEPVPERGARPRMVFAFENGDGDA